MTQHDSQRDETFIGFIILAVLLVGVTILLFLAGPNSSISGTRAAAVASATPTPRPPTHTPRPTQTPMPTDTPPPTDVPASANAEPAGGNTASASTYDPAQVSAGETLFLTTCSACHGMDARGIPGLGKDLVASEFVTGLTDEELLTFITTGRPIWDPLNTTGVDMPPRGGNPALSDDDIYAIIAYIRTLSSQSG